MVQVLRVFKGLKLVLWIFCLFVGVIFFTACIQSERTSPEDSVKKIASLPYLMWSDAGDSIEKSGVTYLDAERSFEGVNLYCSRNLPKAFLMDREGHVRHTWSSSSLDDTSWQHIELCDDGALLVIVKDEMLVRMDWNSNIQWITRKRFHHDIALAENGEIFTFTRWDDVRLLGWLPFPVLNSQITVLAPDGEVRRGLPLFPLFKIYLSESLIPKIYKWLGKEKTQAELRRRKKDQGYMFMNVYPVDVFHPNTIEIIDRDIPGLCKKGDLLICFYRLDLAAIVNMEQKRIVWEWGQGELSGPHCPTLLEDGNILIFDNGVNREWSRIVEVDPLKKDIVWEYRTDPPEKFFSLSRGSCQRLPNGNTLITESDRGHVFEVTKEGDVVWEFFNPEVIEEQKKRAAIYRMVRISESHYKRILSQHSF